MDKWRFKEVLKKEGYRVDKNESIPTVIVKNGEKSTTYLKIKLLANKAGYKHSFGVKESNIVTTVVDEPEGTIETSVIDWPEEESDGDKEV